MEKMTKRDYFNAIRAILAEDNNNDSLVAFIDHELELLEKKNASRSTKPTAKQVANIDLMNAIYEGMSAGVQYTVTELNEKIPALQGLTINKVNALVHGLKLDGRVRREEVKGRAYFTKI